MPRKSYKVSAVNGKGEKQGEASNIAVIDVKSENGSLHNEVEFEEALNDIGEGRERHVCADK